MTAEAAANKAVANQDKADHEAAMTAHAGRHAMVTTLAVAATNEESIDAEVAAQKVALGAGDTVHMQD